MSETEVLLSELAAEQLAALAQTVGRPLIDALARLIAFPESGPRLRLEGYEAYRQVVVKNHRAIYRYFPEENRVRVYCILHTRRRLPPIDILTYELF
jgi:plasmid stabilization system protein ParE